MRRCGVVFATFTPSVLVYLYCLIKRKDAMRATEHTVAICWRRIEILIEGVVMNETQKDQVLQCGDYLIEASASLLSDHWYPEYQISRHGAIIAPRQRPACFGFEEKVYAILEAFKYAIADLNPGEARRT